MSSHINHRLNCENIAGLYLRTLSWLAVIGYLRVFVHTTTDSVTHIVTHHRIAVPFSVLLHSGPDVSQMFSGTTLFDREAETLLSDANQIQPFVAYSSHRNGSRRVSHKSTERHATVNRKYVAFLELVI